jgi:hypothetical protein
MGKIEVRGSEVFWLAVILPMCADVAHEELAS